MRVASEERALKEELARLTSEVERLTRELHRARSSVDQHKVAAGEKERQLERYAADLKETFKEERARSQELRKSYTATVRALSNAVEARDAYTGKHAERVTAYGIQIARAFGTPTAELAELEFGYLLHDIGKVAIADAILYKSGPLTGDEWALMAQHPVIGAGIVAGIEFLQDAVAVIRSHHERWDGQGYPDGLAGGEIPLAARIFSVADALDALTTERPYRRASSFAVGREMISTESGAQFDPVVVEAFNTIPDETFLHIRTEIG